MYLNAARNQRVMLRRDYFRGCRVWSTRHNGVGINLRKISKLQSGCRKYYASTRIRRVMDRLAAVVVAVGNHRKRAERVRLLRVLLLGLSLDMSRRTRRMRLERTRRMIK